MPKDLFFRLSFMMFLEFFVWGTWYVTTGVYLRKSLGFTGSEIGWVYSCSGIAAIIMPFIIGRLADKYFPIERLMAVLHTIAGFALLMAAKTNDFAHFFPWILLNALAYQPTMSLAISMSFYHQKEGMGQFPRIRLWGTTGWIVGGIIVSVMAWENVSMPLTFSGCVSFALAAYCLTLPSAKPLGKNTGMRDVFQLVNNKALIYTLIAMVFIMVPASFYYSFVNPFLVEKGVHFPAAKMSYGQVSEIIILSVLPFIMKKLSWRKMITIGFFVWGARYLLFLLPNAQTEFHYNLALALHGIAFCFSALTAQIFVNHIARPEMKSTAQGAYSLVVMGIGSMLGNIIAGNVVDLASTSAGVISWDYVWTFAGIFGISSAVVFFLTSAGRFNEHL